MSASDPVGCRGAPSAPRQNRFRRTALRLHNWLGVVFGVFVLLLSLTGAPLVFKHEIEIALSPHLPLSAEGEPLSIDRIAGQAVALRPGSQLRGLNYPADAYGSRDWTRPWRLTVATAGRSETIWLDPVSGLEIPRPGFDLGQFLRDIHVRLYLTEPRWLRDIVQIFVGLIGVAMLVSSVTGLLFSRHLLRDMLRWRHGRSRRGLLGGWHKLAGLWLLAFHVVIAVSGAAVSTITLPGTFRQFSPTPPDVRPYDDAMRDVTLAEVQRAAEQAIPGSVALWISMPQRQDGTIRVFLRPLSPWLRHGDDRVSIDPRDGAVRSRSAVAEDAWYWRLYSLMWPLHFGYFAGLGSRVAYAAFGLAPALLAITGLMIWRDRTRRKASKKPG